MANNPTPNVAALAKLLRAIDWNSDYQRELTRRAASAREADTFSDEWVVLAEWLAKEGVLVISDAVLTDKLCAKINCAGNGAHTFWPEEQRAVLASIAKGDTQ